MNAEQTTAVNSIIKNTSHPYPFVLFGPPGTGKTKTLVEAVAQIVTATSKNVLLCAASNAACDVLVSRLLLVIPDIFVYRMYSSMALTGTTSQNVKNASNVCDGDAFYPSLENIQLARVLVCTTTVAGRLTQADIGQKYPGHFSYVLIDECASSTEASALIPIAGKKILIIGYQVYNIRLIQLPSYN